MKTSSPGTFTQQIGRVPRPATVYDKPSPTDRVQVPVCNPHAAYLVYADHYKQYFGNTTGLIDRSTFVSRINAGRVLTINGTEYKKP